MMGSHVVVARYDMLALDVLDSDCIFIGDTSSSTDCSADASPSPNGSPTPTRGGLGRADRQPGARGDTGRERPARRHDPAVGRQGAAQHPAHRQPTSDRATGPTTPTPSSSCRSTRSPSRSRCSACRATPWTCRPRPDRHAAPSARSTRRKINAWWTSVRTRNDLFPGKGNLPGYNGLKAIMGNLYGLDIKYFVEVNFDGFKKVVDTMGGVTINVQVPVTDDRFPAIDNSLRRVYIPSGIQHMDGAEALRYARSRHGSNDFDRGLRQQRVLLSLREQADPQDLIPRLPDLVKALKSTVKTDIPVAQLAPLLGLASEVDTKNIRSYVFTPPFYQKEYTVEPARLHHRPERQQDPGRGEATRSRPIRPTRPSARSWPRRRPACGSSTGRATRPRHRDRGLSRLPRRWPRHRRARSRRARSRQHDDRRLQRRRPQTCRTRSPTSRRRSGSTVTEKTDPAIRTDIVVTVGQVDAEPRGAARSLTRARAAPPAVRRPRRPGSPTRSASASARIRAADREPPRSSGRARAARSARSRPTRPADGRPR